MILTDWLTVVGVCVLGAVSPGPSLGIVIKHTLISGRPGGTAAALSHGFGIGLYAFICISGLAFVITTSPALFTTLQWVGAAYLIWLGVKGLVIKGTTSRVSSAVSQETSTATEPIAEADASQSHSSYHSLSVIAPETAQHTIWYAVRDGFMIVFFNPKIALFFIALFSQLVGPDTSPLARTIYVMTALIIDAGWYLFVAWLISFPLWLQRLRRHAVWFERLFGLILIIIGGRLVMDLL